MCAEVPRRKKSVHSEKGLCSLGAFLLSLEEKEVEGSGSGRVRREREHDSDSRWACHRLNQLF